VPSRDIHVVGSSAGGVEALKRLVSDLPSDFPASLLIVQHLSPSSIGVLPAILERMANVPVQHAVDGAPLQRGHIYVAPPDQHLILEPGKMRVVSGPKENRHRPAVDPLFRSAAWSYGPRVVGTVLTGTLDDGTAGLWAIKEQHGIAVVQDPSDATYPSMPQSALSNVRVDHRLPLKEIGSLLNRLARQDVALPAPRDERMRTETEFDMLKRDIKSMSELGTPSGFTCPECNGALWEIRDGELYRYRCHVGHAFSADTLLQGQGEQIEAALFSAIRALEEKAALLRRLIARYGSDLQAHDREMRAQELDRAAEAIRRLLRAGSE